MGNYVTTPTTTKNDLSETDSIELANRIVTRYGDTSSSVEDANLRHAMQNLDTLLARVLQEKALLKAIQKQQQQTSKTENNSDNKIDSSPFGPLVAQILNNVPEEARKPSSAIAAPLYRCPMESMNRNQPQQQQDGSKVNYKNLFPRKPSTDNVFGSLLSSYQVEDVTNNYNQQRRYSQMIAGLLPTEMMGAMSADTNTTSTDSGSLESTIRINLPEILDQQDEVTILRLLIKLLANKVTKLTDEKGRLLQSVSVLNDINAEMASIIERGIQK